MSRWMETLNEERWRALCRREIEAAVREVKGYRFEDAEWRNWYVNLVRRRRESSPRSLANLRLSVAI